MKILFVENHARFAAATVKAFLALHDVTVVASVAAARGVFDNDNFDVLLVDYDLDDGKGSEFIEAIRQKTRVPIIAVSSHQEGNHRLLQAGADAVCSKMNFRNIAEVMAQL